MMLQLDCEPTVSDTESRKAVGDFVKATVSGRLGPYQQHMQLEGKLPGATCAVESMSWPLHDLVSFGEAGRKVLW